MDLNLWQKELAVGCGDAYLPAQSVKTLAADMVAAGWDLRPMLDDTLHDGAVGFHLALRRGETVIDQYPGGGWVVGVYRSRLAGFPVLVFDTPQIAAAVAALDARL